MLFTIAKMIHVTAVILSISGFIWRCYDLLSGQQIHKNNKLLTRLPHINDSILLASAIIMLWQWQLNPFTLPWLTEKIVILCVYILLGMIALHWCRRQVLQVFSMLTAIVCFGYMIYVAMTKNTILGEVIYLLLQ